MNSLSNSLWSYISQIFYACACHKMSHTVKLNGWENVSILIFFREGAFLSPFQNRYLLLRWERLTGSLARIFTWRKKVKILWPLWSHYPSSLISILNTGKGCLQTSAFRHVKRHYHDHSIDNYSRARWQYTVNLY